MATAAIAGMSRPISTTKLRLRGAGPYWASAPASTGPAPHAAVVVVAARNEARACRPRGSVSTSPAVSAPEQVPTARPCTARPANRAAAPDAAASRADPAAAAASPASSTGRSPAVSLSGPQASRATMTAAAYTATSRVTPKGERPNRRS